MGLAERVHVERHFSNPVVAADFAQLLDDCPLVARARREGR